MRQQLKGKELWQHLRDEHGIGLPEKSVRGYIYRDSMESYLARLHFEAHEKERQ